MPMKPWPKQTSARFLSGRGWRAVLAASLLVTLAAPTASALEFIKLEDECNGRQLLLKGDIEPGDFDRFLARMAQHVVGDPQPEVQDPEVLWTIELDSPGGDLAEAMRIGRFLRSALAITQVSYRFAQRPDGVWDHEHNGRVVCLEGEDRLAGCAEDITEAECTGACLLIWLAGGDRYADAGRLGEHGLAGSGDDVRAYLVQMGVPQPWIRRLLDAAPAGDGWLSWPERHELSGRAEALDQLLAGCPPALNQEESFASLIAPSEAERNALLDRADAYRTCRRARLAEVRTRLTESTLAGAGSAR